MRHVEIKVADVTASAYKIATDAHEADGTFEWDSTTLIVVQVTSENTRGLGFTYADAATASTVLNQLKPLVVGTDAMNIPAVWTAMTRGIRNLGRPGVDAMAIAAVDIALWDLKARLLDVPLVTLLGSARAGVPAYGSGGFTSYTDEQMRSQLRGWAESGISRFKIKVGAEPDRDASRVKVAREAIGPDKELYVDANGAYSRKQAIAMAERFQEYGVSWFEEPVVAEDLAGLRLIRDRGPAGMDIAAGEYGYGVAYFRRMLDAGAVDVLQADASRCGGITGFLKAAVLAEAHDVPLSSHCGPSLHVHPGCAARPMRHIEYFHDHARIEQMLFDGAPIPKNGVLFPDLSKPGLGLEFKEADAAKYTL